MAQQKIYLSKVRDFGENLGDTFQFIRQEFKPLMKSFILISGIFMLASAIVGGFYQMELWSILDQVKGRPGDVSFITSIFSGTYFLILLLAVFGMMAMKLSIAAYMKLYEKNGTSPGLEEVWSEFRRYFFPALILTILVWLLIIVGLVLCIFPGIYLMVVFAPAVAIMVNEDASIGEAFSRCFRLIKENFWLSLGIYIVAYLIYMFAAGAIGAVIGIFAGIGSYLTTREMDSTVGIVTSITNIFSYCFYIVFYVSVCLHYYSLAERLDGFGMMKRLEGLGSSNSNDKIEEQY